MQREPDSDATESREQTVGAIWKTPCTKVQNKGGMKNISLAFEHAE